ncbi:hypothetical protein SAMN05216276_102247 [Streptosporangium subroseum]|uniref:Uncharacterized protein n=1 Tax=Streptosporangium subroseum TaxID=106412 RepID=A0A239JB78_9ACTN|nr:hypothetical protein [Streptosporangium subroseum]SNT03049.1 hypothetical protein SAMN05216276_102247 [Streptosporangium subroseum]
MSVYSFELHFTAPSGEETIDALYEAGWDDATVSLDPVTGGPGVAAFDREASTAVEAIASAIAQGRAAGVEVTGVSEDLVTLGGSGDRLGDADDDQTSPTRIPSPAPEALPGLYFRWSCFMILRRPARVSAYLS